MTTGAPTSVIAAPLYNKAGYLAQTLESLLGQTNPDLALVLVDDCSTDATGLIARAYAQADSRVSFYRNGARLGLLENTRKAHGLARALHPAARYFAFASDHDLWHPSWLARLVAALEANEDAVLAYPHVQRVLGTGEIVPGRRVRAFDTVGVASPRARFTATLRQTTAGDMIYGLFRAEELDDVGGYRHLLLPDRLMLAELALRGEFVQVPEVLWSRRFAGPATVRRQRAASFPDGPSAASYLPPWLVHAVTILRDYGLRGHGRPRVSRGEGARLAVSALRVGAWVQAAHRTLTPRQLVMKRLRGSLARARDLPSRLRKRLRPARSLLRKLRTRGGIRLRKLRQRTRRARSLPRRLTAKGRVRLRKLSYRVRRARSLLRRPTKRLQRTRERVLAMQAVVRARPVGHRAQGQPVQNGRPPRRERVVR